MKIINIIFCTFLIFTGFLFLVVLPVLATWPFAMALFIIVIMKKSETIDMLFDLNKKLLEHNEKLIALITKEEIK